MSGNCNIEHDWFTAVLTFGLCCGLIISYLPQHLRIIQAGSSEGLSPLFLLLGSTSAASAMLNMLTMQSGVIKCCSVVGLGTCIEISAGIVQLSIQWIFFSLIFVLYMLYYPPHLKYNGLDLRTEEDELTVVKSNVLSQEWRLSIIFAWITAIHFFIAVLVTLFILTTAVPSPSAGEPLPPLAYSWAKFLGVSSAVLASIQYAPQLLHTYRAKLVGALSIPMMLIQTPGAILMVTSIALRPGTNWTSWITFAVAGIMQGTLLVMCLFWKVRQRKLGIDDFGVSLDVPEDVETTAEIFADEIPALIVTAPSGSSSAPVQTGSVDDTAHEQTPLLGSQKAQRSRGWWFNR